jgi:hypothetical protein
MINRFEQILSRIPQEEIMQKYFPEPIKLGKKYCSPYRKDTTPTCTFAYINGVLYFKDFGIADGHKNCFHICALANQCDLNMVLRIIDRDFKLNLFGPNTMSGYKTRIDTIKYDTEPLISPNAYATDIFVTLRPFNTQDLVFYGQGGISESTLKLFNVRAVEKCWINGAVWHTYKPDDPIYRYREGQEVKVYRPFAKDKSDKFRSNYSVSVECIENLSYTTDTLFITKSRKDVMTLFELGYEAVSVKSETVFVPEIIMQQFKLLYKKIYVFFDNDTEGVKNSIKLTQHYGLEYINIPKGMPKDPFDFVKHYSKEELNKLIKTKCFDSI